MNEKDIVPLNNNVLVRLHEVSETFGSSKIVKPDFTKDEEGFQCPRGTVIAVGPGKRATKTGIRIPIDLKPGDTCVIRKHMKEIVIPYDNNLVMIDAEMVMAVAAVGAID